MIAPDYNRFSEFPNSTPFLLQDHTLALASNRLAVQGCPVVHLVKVHHGVNHVHVVTVVKNVLTDESHECKREARITSRKPSRRRRQLAVTTDPSMLP